MSVTFSQLPDGLINDPDVTLSQIKVYHAIYVQTLGRPGWDISWSQLAELTGQSRRTVAYAVEALIERGWLTKVSQKDPKTGAQRPSLYGICRAPFTSWHTPEPGTPLHHPVQSDTPPPLQPVAPTRRESIQDKDTPSSPHGGEEEHLITVPVIDRPEADPFDDWWGLYPRKVGKKSAAKAYKAAVKGGATPAQLLAGLRQQLPGMLKQEQKYRPHPTTWLNAGRWDDEVDTPTTHRKAPGVGYYVEDGM